MATAIYIIVFLIIEVSVCSSTTLHPTRTGGSTSSDYSDSVDSEETESYDEDENYASIRQRKCQNYHCLNAQECVLDANMEPYCSCDLICPAIYAPVCGTDGRTYSNNCQLTVASCDAEHSINLIYEGKCGSLKSTGWYLLMKIALPTGIVATVVFLCLVICWCRKGAEYNYSCCPPSFPRYHDDDYYSYNHNNTEPIVPVQYSNDPISTVTIPNDITVNSCNSESQQHTALLRDNGHETPPPTYEEATRS